MSTQCLFTFRQQPRLTDMKFISKFVINNNSEWKFYKIANIDIIKILVRLSSFINFIVNISSLLTIQSKKWLVMMDTLIQKFSYQ